MGQNRKTKVVNRWPKGENKTVMLALTLCHYYALFKEKDTFCVCSNSQNQVEGKGTPFMAFSFRGGRRL